MKHSSGKFFGRHCRCLIPFAAAALAVFCLSRANAQNTQLVFTSGTDLTVSSNWNSGAGPVPGVANDAVFNASSTSGTLSLSNATATYGSLDVTHTGTTTLITNVSTTGNTTLTLGGSGDLGDSVSGAASTDLIYLSTGTTVLTISGASKPVNVVLGQSGAFDVGSTSTLNLGNSGVASTLNLGGFTLTISGAGAVNIGAAISNGSVAISAGTTVLSGANLFSGGLSFSGGTVILNSLAGAGAGPITISGGTLEGQNTGTFVGYYANPMTWDSSFNLSQGGKTSAFSGNVTLGAAGITVTANGNFSSKVPVVSGVISDGGHNYGLAVSGLLALAGANTYTGATTINSGGTLVLGGTSNGNLLVGTTGSLSPSGAIVDNGVFGFYRSNTVTQGADFSSSPITGSGGVTLESGNSGMVILNAANTYTGVTTITSGTLQLGASLAAQNSTIAINAGTGTTGLNNGLRFSGAVGGAFTIGGLNGSSNEALLDTNGSAAALTIGNNNNTGMSYSGDLSGGGSLTKIGTGTQTLTGSNSYTGATTVNGGTLALTFAVNQVNVINNTSNSSALTLAGGTLTLNGVASSTNTQQLNGVTLSPGASAITMAPNVTSNPLLLSANGITRNIGSVANFTLNGASTASNGITTSNSNDANGLLGAGLTVNANDWATVSSGNIVAFSSYTTQDALGSWGTDQNINGGSSAYTGSLSGNLTINSLRLAFNGSSTTTLGSNTLTVLDGILVTGSVSSRADVLSGGSIEGSSGGDLVVINNGAGATLLTISSNVVDNSLPTPFTKGGADKVTLSGAGNTYSGATYVDAGTLSAGVATTAFGNNSAVVISTGATLDISGAGFNETIGSLASNPAGGAGAVTLGTNALTIGGNNTSTTFGGVLSGASGSLVKVGTGSQTLSGVNTYTGATTIDAGTLIVSGSLSGSSAVTVGDSANLTTPAILAGGGSVGSVTLGAAANNTGAEVEPADGVTESVSGSGTTLSTGAFTIGAASGATLAMQIGRSSAGASLAGDASDHISVSGNISLDGNLQLSLETGYTPSVNDILYLIIHNSGTSTTGSFADVNGVALTGNTFNYDNFTWQITDSASASGNSFTGGDDVAIEVVAAIPEPSTWASILAGFGMLVLLQKNRRRRI